MGAIKFLVQGIRRFKEVGTISRSSQFVGKTMAKHVDFDKAKCIVELGAGDGSITKQLIKNMKADTKLLSFEINEKFCEDMKEQWGDDDRVQIIQDDALKMKEYINAAGFEYADYIVSAIPFVIIPEDDIIEEAYNNLRPGNNYIQLHYSTVAKKRYERIFGNAKLDFVMLNVPPAFIHVCKKEAAEVEVE